MKKVLSLLSILIVSGTTSVYANAPLPNSTGQISPSFEGTGENVKSLSLASLLGDNNYDVTCDVSLANVVNDQDVADLQYDIDGLPAGHNAANHITVDGVNTQTQHINDTQVHKVQFSQLPGNNANLSIKFTLKDNSKVPFNYFCSVEESDNPHAGHDFPK